MKLKDALVAVLTWLGILGFLAIFLSIDGWPMGMLIVLAAIVWSVYILVIIRDYQRDLKYPHRSSATDRDRSQRPPAPLRSGRR